LLETFLIKNKKIRGTKAIAGIALTLIMTFATLIAFAPIVNATEFQTYIYMDAAPNPVGTGQTVYLTFIMPNVPPAQYPAANPRFGYWVGITITVTKPDGTLETLTGLQTGEAGAGYTAYTPSQLGTYKFQVNFPGQTIQTGASTGDYYKPSTSPIISLNVQNQPVQMMSEYPLPTNYWTFPVEGENRLWSTMAGNWLAGDNVNASTNGYNPYTTTPGSAHILWSQQRMPGGIVGGSYGPDIYNYGRWPGSGNGAYFGPPIIINGIIYLNEPQTTGDRVGFSAYNLATGEMLWKNDNNDSITFGTVFQFESRMMSNVYSYLWSASGTTWRVYEAYSGKLMQTIANVTSGTTAFGPSGELLVYSLSGTTLRMWNSTLYFYSTHVSGNSVTYGPNYVPNNIWAPNTGTFDFKGGWQWSITVPTGLGSINKIIPNDALIFSRSFAATNTTDPIAQQAGISIKDGLYTGNGSGQQAQLLWGPINRTLWIGNAGYERIEAVGDGIFVMYKRELLQVSAYDVHTGTKLWTADPFDSAFSMFNGESNNFVIADGKVFTGGYDGVMRAYAARTGVLLWKTSVGSSNYETAYGSYPIGGSYDYFKIGGGVLFAGTNEHSPSIIPYRNAKIWAFNTTDGTIIWSLLSTLSEVQNPAIAEGVYIYMNGYDGKVYCLGKGPSETTVSATVGSGNAITIQGTVTDKSPGAKQLITDSLFNIVPAISDASQSAWMEYLYMQKPMPTNATGVSVTIFVSDENDNLVYTTTATSDISGHYVISWTPITQGTYKITAAFDGSESYYPSTGTTGMAVGEQATPQVTPTVTPTQIVEPTPTVTPTTTASPSAAVNNPGDLSTETLLIIGAAVIIVITVIVAAVVLRKRK